MTLYTLYNENIGEIVQNCSVGLVRELNATAKIIIGLKINLQNLTKQGKQKKFFLDYVMLMLREIMINFVIILYDKILKKGLNLF